MTSKTSTSLVAAALLGLGMIVAPNLASAGDSAAPIQPPDPQTLQNYGGGMPMMSSNGTVVSGDAWCDPLSDVCNAHPWLHHGRTK